MIEYKRENHGFEFYLVSEEDPMQAMRRTSTDDPLVCSSPRYFDVNHAREIDSLVTNAVYNHTPEAIREFFDAIRDMS